MRYLVMFLLAVSLCAFTLGCGGEKETKTKKKEDPAKTENPSK